MRTEIEVTCYSCKTRFMTAYKIGHWETCPRCHRSFYVTHDNKVREFIEAEEKA